jgi:hypothetical protein
VSGVQRDAKLALAVEDRLGRVVFVSPAHADVIIDGRIEPATAPATFRAHITVSSPNGEPLGTRDLEGTGTVARSTPRSRSSWRCSSIPTPRSARTLRPSYPLRSASSPFAPRPRHPLPRLHLRRPRSRGAGRSPSDPP